MDQPPAREHLTSGLTPTGLNHLDKFRIGEVFLAVYLGMFLLIVLVVHAERRLTKDPDQARRHWRRRP